MSGLLGLYRPNNAEASADGRQGQLADVVAGQLQRALAADGGLGILREGRAAVDLLKDTQVTLRIGDGLEATEVLVMLVEAANDAFDGVIGRRDQVGADAVGEPGPMAFQEVKDDDSLGPGLDVVLTQGQDCGVTFRGQGQGFGVEDALDLLLELLGLRMLRGIVRAVGRLDMHLRLLQSMEDAFVMLSLRKDLGDHRAVVLAQVSHDDLRMVALGPQGQQEGGGTVLVLSLIHI